MTSFPRALQLLGLKPLQIQDWLAADEQAHPWRVRAVDRGLCRLVSVRPDTHLSANEDIPATAGNSTTAEAEQWPEPFVTRNVRPGHAPVAVGDWVLVSEIPEPRITRVLERATVLRRGATLDRSDEQLIATNIDVVFVVCAFAETEKLLRRGLNPRRIERYVAAVTDGGATPVCLLNKSDLAPEAEAARSELARRLKSVDVLCVSAEQGDGVRNLAPYLGAGQSVAFVGQSGVGKSTLINRLLGSETQNVGEVRGVDTKGKHTTTRREMLRMPDGTLVIDTPGLRELALSTQTGSVGFEDIEQLAKECRFSDCAHETEPGCAVTRAIDEGTLPAERLASYRKLASEALRQQARHDAYARRLQNQEHRRFGKLVKEAVKTRRRN